jgi:hypothetical protein
VIWTNFNFNSSLTCFAYATTLGFAPFSRSN